jgi:hypothetical protein
MIQATFVGFAFPQSVRLLIMVRGNLITFFPTILFALFLGCAEQSIAKCQAFCVQYTSTDRWDTMLGTNNRSLSKAFPVSADTFGDLRNKCAPNGGILMKSQPPPGSPPQGTAVQPAEVCDGDTKASPRKIPTQMQALQERLQKQKQQQQQKQSSSSNDQDDSGGSDSGSASSSAGQR